MKGKLKKLLPKFLYERAKSLYKENITNYKRDIYSEFGEDFIAAVLLSFKEKGFYVDIGAFRPKELSTTYYFYKKLNWSGIVIEPNPKVMSEFNTQRPNDIIINQGVSLVPGEMNYYEFKDPTLNSFSAKVYESRKGDCINKLKIFVNRLDELLEAHIPKGTTIDLMNIDVEGLDLEVLKSNDWTRFSPKVIIVEDHSFEPELPLESETVQFLKSHGYSLKANCLISLIFQRD